MQAVKLDIEIAEDVLPGAFIVLYVNETGDADSEEWRRVAGRIPARRPGEIEYFFNETPFNEGPYNGWHPSAGFNETPFNEAPFNEGATYVKALAGSFYGGRGDGILRFKAELYDRAGQVSSDKPTVSEHTLSTYPRTGRNLRVGGYSAGILTMNCDASPDL